MKQSCKYHPATRARWYCAHDGIRFCDDCVAATDPSGRKARCLICNRVVQALPSPVEATPFYTILPYFLRYPFSLPGALAAVVLALPLAWAGFGLFAIAVLLVGGLAAALLGGAVMVEGTEGRMSKPDLNVFSEGVGRAQGILLWLLWAALAVLAGGLLQEAGMAAAVAVVVLASLLLPAVLLAVLRGPGVLDGLRRIHAPPLVLGRDYGGMALAVGIAGLVVLGVSWVLLDLLPAWLAAPLAGVLLVWWWLFAARLAGYLACQYQHELEIETRERQLMRRRERSRRPEEERRQAVQLREGRYDKVLATLERRLEKKPEALVLNEQYARLLEAMGRQEQLIRHADQYMGALVKAEQEHRLAERVRRYREMQAEYRPSSPELRWRSARALAEAGDAREAVRLLHGMHEQHPDWHGLGEAYIFLARLLGEKLDMREKAAQFLTFVERNFPRPKLREQVAEARKALGIRS